MNFEKIGYSIIGSLIAGSVIQKNMGLEQKYFFFISLGLWMVCLGIQWWNCKIEKNIRDKFENASLESRDIIIKQISEIISKTNEKERKSIKEEIDVLCNLEASKFDELIVYNKNISSDLQTVIGLLNQRLAEITHINQIVSENVKTIPKAETLLNSIIKVNNSIMDNMKLIEKTSVDNKDYVCGEIVSIREMIADNHKDAVVKFEEVTGKTKKDICSQLIEQSSCIQEIISETNEKERKSIKEEIDVLCNLGASKFDELIVYNKNISSDLQTVIGSLNQRLAEITHINQIVSENVKTVLKAEALLNSIIKVNNSIMDNMKLIEKTSVDNKDYVCSEIVSIREMVADNHKDAVVRFEEVTGKTKKDICLQLVEQSSCIQEFIKQKIAFDSQQSEKTVSTIEAVTGNIINQIKNLQDKLEVSENTLNDTFKNEQKSTLESLSKLMNSLHVMNDDTKDQMSEIHNELCGILSNLQGILESAESKIGEIQNIDYIGLLEDTKTKICEVEDAINDGVSKIEDTTSQSIEKQNEIITEEKCILDSYDKLLGRINDEVIAKLTSDSNTLLKCMKDCYNLLDSQRRIRR